MRPVTRFFILLVFLFVITFPSHSVLADTGPKPSMDFTFVQDFAGAPVAITSGILLQCDDPDCGNARPLERLGPQGINCQDLHCSAHAYGFSDYNQLEITFSDGVVRRSNVFTAGQFNAVYEVTIQKTDLVVKEKFNPGDIQTWPLVCAGGICLAIILLVVILILVLRRLKKKA